MRGREGNFESMAGIAANSTAVGENQYEVVASLRERPRKRGTSSQSSEWIGQLTSSVNRFYKRQWALGVIELRFRYYAIGEVMEKERSQRRNLRDQACLLNILFTFIMSTIMGTDQK